MKKLYIFTILALLSGMVQAQVFTQTFTGAAAQIPSNANTYKCFPITVSGVGVISSSTIGLSQVCVNITHPYDDEMEMVIKAPDGTIVPLSVQNGGAGNNYNNTCFTATATIPIKAGTAPFAGTYLPEGHLGAVNNGQNANGTWTLCVTDRRNTANVGTLNSFTLTFSNAPAPEPPPFPACTTTLPGNSSCANATSVCDFSGLCGSTSGSTVQTWTNSNLAQCFGLENNSFIKFVASAATASFSIWVPTTQNGNTNYFSGGIQMLFFSGTCGSGPVTSYGCYPHIYPYSAGKPVISVVYATGLTPGNTYYLMIDGFGGDKCNFRVEALSGVNILNITPPAASVCPGGSVNLTASGGTTYTWSPAATLSSPTGATVTATPTATTTYTVTSTPIGSCPISKNVTVTLSPRPLISAQPATATQSVCAGSNFTALSVTATAGAGTISGYQWYSNTTASTTGGTLIPGATGATYTPPSSTVGTLYYYVVITNSGTCTTTSNISGALTVNAGIPAPTVGPPVQPTCTVPTGTITVTAPTGAGYTYSIDGVNYQTSPIFNNVPPGSYSVTVKDANCTSPATPVVINTVPGAPTTPAGTATQPTCTNANGTITVTTPLGAGLQYSIPGFPLQTSPVFNNVPPGSYIITVSNGTCSATGAPVVINAAPATPGVPTGTPTQPTCTNPNGAITVTSPLGAGLQYSIPGFPAQTSPVFNNVPPGSYLITVTNGTCSANSATPVVINTAAGTPATPAGTATQPTCVSATGTITVTTPLGAGLQYSIPGFPLQTSPVFNNVPPGSYIITVSNGTCSATSTPVVINAAPAVPAAPTGTPTQPTCTNPNGTITVTSPLGAGLQYSIPGFPAQTSPVFNNVPPGSYIITVTNGTCSANSAAPVVINTVAGAPTTPAGTPTQPTCTNSTGTITVTTPLGAGLQYSIPGFPLQTSPVFNNVPPGSYIITVSNGTCSATSTPVVINAAPAVPAVPTGTPTQPTCTNPNGTITVTSPLGAGLQYSIPGFPVQTSPVFNNVPPGSYVITVTNGTCSANSAAPVVINTVAGAPTTPAGTATQPTCPTPSGTITVTTPLGAGFTYSVNGTTFQASPVFPGLIPGTYTITVSNGTCTATSTPVVINAIPTPPAAPSVTVTTSPTCANPTATFTITNPIGANLEYNVDAGGYQTSPVFPGLAAGVSHSFTVRNTVTLCVSTVTTQTATIPGAPAQPTLLPVQASCRVNGSITVVTPTGANLQYNIDGGVYQTSPSFTNLAPGTYTIRVKDMTTGCESTVRTQVITNTNPVPATPNATATKQPSCTDNIGTITVSSPVGAGLQYSINGVNYQTSTVFNNVAPGSYNVTVRNNTCVSDPFVVVINNPPATPAAPTVQIIRQPTCTNANGTITITNPTGPTFLYSINGGTFLTGPVFDLTTGTYQIRVQNTATGCISASSPVTIDPKPVAPAAPLVTGASRCGAGGVNLSASGTGGIITWYSDAALTSPVASGNTYSPSVLATTTFYVAVVGTSCTGPATPVTATINPFPTPTLGANRAVCKGDPLVLSPGAFATYLWQNGATTPTFNVTTSGTYTVTVTNAAGCPATASVTIEVVEDCNDIYFPNAITPNNDTRNDEFGPLPPASLSFVTNYNLAIFNRYGERVFQSNNPAKRWDGKYHGKILAGNYVWYASYLYRGKERSRKGNILVIK